MTQGVVVDLSDLAPLGTPSDAVCPVCEGTGLVPSTELTCCGNYLPSGECCTAIYGDANLVLEPSQEQCGVCRGMGMLDE